MSSWHHTANINQSNMRPLVVSALLAAIIAVLVAGSPRARRCTMRGAWDAVAANDPHNCAPRSRSRSEAMRPGADHYAGWP